MLIDFRRRGNGRAQRSQLETLVHDAPIGIAVRPQ
jgi:hypothetical protein